MIISKSYFRVAILVVQQSFLRLEIKLIQLTYPLLSWVIQKNSLYTVGNIQFLKTTINLEKYENHIFSTWLARGSDLSKL